MTYFVSIYASKSLFLLNFLPESWLFQVLFYIIMKFCQKLLSLGYNDTAHFLKKKQQKSLCFLISIV